QVGQAPPPRFRRHRRAGLGRGPRLRRQGAGLCRAAAMKLATLDALRRARAEKRPIALVTELGSGAQALVTADRHEGELALPPDIVRTAREALRHDSSRTVEHDGARYFIHSFNPPLRLVIVGAVHIAQPLARMAQLAGYDVTL